MGEAAGPYGQKGKAVPQSPGPANVPVEDQNVTLRTLSVIPGDNAFLDGRTPDGWAELEPVADGAQAPQWVMHEEGPDHQFSLVPLGLSVNAWLSAGPPPADSTQPAARASVTTTKGSGSVWTIVDDVNTDEPNAVLIMAEDGRYLRAAPIDTTVDLVPSIDTMFRNTTWQLGPVEVGSPGGPPIPHPNP